MAFSGEKLRVHERERGCAYETVNEGREKGGRQGYRKRKGDTTGQHAVREASMSLLGSQSTELVSPKVLDPWSSR